MENESPNKPIFEFLIKKKETKSWARCATTNLKTALSPPLTQVITDTPNIHHREPGPSHGHPGFTFKKPKMDNNTKKPPEDSLKSTKAEVFDLVRDALIDKKSLEKKLFEKQIKREDLQLKFLKRKLQDCGGTILMIFQIRIICLCYYQLNLILYNFDLKNT